MVYIIDILLDINKTILRYLYTYRPIYKIN
nr:MAG TPA: hypothetical protein [Caudoviricetes sp.]